LKTRGYDIDFRVLSPHMFGIPQVRPRVIILGARNGLKQFEWPQGLCDQSPLHLSSVLDQNPKEAKSLPENYQRYLEVWEEFLHILPNDTKLPSFPIWAMEFAADYPMETKSPITYSKSYLGRFRGSFGRKLAGMSKGQQLATIPTYARGEAEIFAPWKIRFIKQNRMFYDENQNILKDWLPKVQEFAPSFQKFEWNWQAGSRTLWDKVIQFRASGIRVKNPSTAPSLVALTTSQIPVIAWEKRYMTMRECARLQSMGNLPCLPSSKTRSYKALGNAVNVAVIKKVAEKLIGAEKHTSIAASEDFNAVVTAKVI
jgi:DNA (cytosine-5)-methyltransferase 1